MDTLLAQKWDVAEFEAALTVLAEAGELEVRRAAERAVRRAARGDAECGNDNGGNEGWKTQILADELRRLASEWRDALREGRAIGHLGTLVGQTLTEDDGAIP